MLLVYIFFIIINKMERSIITFQNRPSLLDISGYDRILSVAETVRINNYQSNYPVREAALTSKGRIIKGGNIEYGKGSSIHGESSITAVAYSLLDEDEKIIVLGILQGGTTNFAECCGNCIDIMKANGKVYDDNFEIAHGAKETDLYVSRFNDHLFMPTKQAKNKDEIKRLLRERFFDGQYDTWINPDATEDYVVLMKTVEGLTLGNFFGNAAYHSTIPTVDALLELKKMKIPTDDIEFVVYYGRKIPDALYKEREFLMEASAMSLKGGKVFPVYLTDGKEVLETDSNEWLPMPFDASNLINSIPELRRKQDEVLKRIYGIK